MVVKINAKCSDLCFTSVIDDQGNEIVQHDGYVPDFMPDEHYNDYIILEIDVKTGKILNWTAKPKDVQAWVKSQGK